METNKNPWKIVSSEEKYDNPWINVVEHKVINPGGGKGIYGKVHFKNIAIGIVPIFENGDTILVGQYRFPLEQYSWEIPEGGGKIGVDPILSAQRELLEETGLIANKWSQLIEMHLSNSVSDEYAIIFIAEDLIQGEAMPEETEQLQLKRLPLNDAIEMVMKSEITDSMSVAALLKLKVLLTSKQ
jgi:8-oxo-dGTP pyrophosphatase MutT (NUDIX family)